MRVTRGASATLGVRLVQAELGGLSVIGVRCYGLTSSPVEMSLAEADDGFRDATLVLDDAATLRLSKGDEKDVSYWLVVGSDGLPPTLMLIAGQRLSISVGALSRL